LTVQLIGVMEDYISFGVKDAKERKIPEDIYYILYNNVSLFVLVVIIDHN